MEHTQVILNYMSACASITPFGDNAIEVMHYITEDLNEYLKTCNDVGVPEFCLYLATRDTIRNLIYIVNDLKIQLERVPNCDDCQDRRIAHPYG